MSEARTKFECCNPILRVADMPAAVRFYVEVLGFQEASWGGEDFTCVSRDQASVYLSRGQGRGGAFVWVGVEDVEALAAELEARGFTVRQRPRNYPWALEMHLEDPDGNCLRIGSEPRSDRPFVEWED